MNLPVFDLVAAFGIGKTYQNRLSIVTPGRNEELERQVHDDLVRQP